jgi:hypothetical protein
MAYTIESYRPMASVLRKERLVVRGFKHSCDMHAFLSKGDNARRWRVSDKGLKPGTYAYAGGKWHNVKTLDASALAHI